MASFFALPILFLLLAATVCIVALVAWVIVSLVNRGGKDSKSSTEESQMMQEIYHGLSKMEARIEALETILLERESKRNA